MKEVKTPKKPLAIYYAIVLLVLMLLNFVLVPWMSERQVKEVDYGTFMSMTEDKDIGRVDVESNQIIFTDKDEKQIYKTGLMNDPDLTQRLYDAGAQFSSEIVEQASPLPQSQLAKKSEFSAMKPLSSRTASPTKQCLRMVPLSIRAPGMAMKSWAFTPNPTTTGSSRQLFSVPFSTTDTPISRA